MPDNAKAARDKLRVWLKRYGRVTHLAEELGCSRQTIYNWRDGVSPPTLDAVREIERVTEGEVTGADWLG